MEKNNRIKIIREGAGLTQGSFGARLGLSNVAVLRLESGQSELTEQLLALICREYHINERWLRDGVGPMHAVDPLTELAELHGLAPGVVELIRHVISLPPRKQYQLIEAINGLSRLTGTLTPAEPATAQNEPLIAKGDQATEGDRVRAVREAAGLSREAFGETIGVSDATVLRMETGKTKVTPQARKLICLSFGVNEAWMATGEGPTRDPAGEDPVKAIAALLSPIKAIS